MNLPRKQAAVVRSALEQWLASGLLDQETGKRLLEDLTPLPFDWHRLGRYALWIAVACILIGVIALLAESWLVELLSRCITLTLGRCVVLCLAAAGLFAWGAWRRVRFPEKKPTTEAVFFLGVMAIAGALSFFSDWLMRVHAYGDLNLDIFYGLFLVAALVYGVLGLALDSRMIWMFALLSLGNWFGTKSGYIGGGTYYLFMPYPTIFSLFGLSLCGLSVFMKRNALWPRLAAFDRCTLSMGLLYLFISLWLMSIFGRDADMTSWIHNRHMDLLFWSLLFGAAACVVLWLGIKYDDGMLRGYALFFLFLNLYTRYFEWFWDSSDKGLFFIILGISLWFLASRAERLWNLGKKPSSSPKDA